MIDLGLTLMTLSVCLIGIMGYCKICDVIAELFFYDNYDFALIVMMMMLPFFIGGALILVALF